MIFSLRFFELALVSISIILSTSIANAQSSPLVTVEKAKAQSLATNNDRDSQGPKDPLILAGSTFHPPIALAVLAGSTFHPKDPDDDDDEPELAYTFNLDDLNAVVERKTPIIVHHGFDPELWFDGYETELLGYEVLTIARVIGGSTGPAMSVNELAEHVSKGPDSKKNKNLLLHGRQVNYENLKFAAGAAGIDFSGWDPVSFPTDYGALLQAAEESAPGSLVIGLRPQDVAKSEILEFVELVDEVGAPVLLAGSVSMFVEEGIVEGSDQWNTLNGYWQAVQNRMEADRNHGRPALHFDQISTWSGHERLVIAKDSLIDKGPNLDVSAVTNSISAPFIASD